MIQDNVIIRPGQNVVHMGSGIAYEVLQIIHKIKIYNQWISVYLVCYKNKYSSHEEVYARNIDDFKQAFKIMETE